MFRKILHNQKTGETRYGNENLFTEWTNNPDLWQPVACFPENEMALNKLILIN